MSNLSRHWPIFLFFPLFFITLAANAANSCININTASKQDLEKIKHIGQARAEQIIKLREEKLFSSVAELSRVIGLGPSRISDIKKEGLACVLEEPQPATTIAEVRPPSVEVEPQNIVPIFYPLLTAFALAIFSGFVILFLKKKIKICQGIPTPKP